MAQLGVWLDGTKVATLRETRGRMSMDYLVDVAPLGVPLVSMSMPVSARRYDDRRARPFFHGLLPEGEARSIIAFDLDLPATDDMGLLEALGRDCAGALVVQALDAEPPPHGPPGSGERIDASGIEARLAALALHPLGVDERIRVSLAGVQPKLLLNRVDGAWHLPVDGAISTHILKPASRLLPDTVTNEALCMRLAAHAGVAAATTSIERFGETEVLVSERFDRVATSDGGLRRVHQEDACQALSILTQPPIRKYEAHGGPSLRAIAGLLQQWGAPHATDELIRHMVVHIAVGDADWHGKNVSFLHGDDGDVRLAPVYDLMSTVHYSAPGRLPAVDTTLGLHIGEATDVRSVGLRDVIEEATRWGVAERRAKQVVDEVVERLPAALARAVDVTADAPAQLVEELAHRTEALRASRTSW